MFITDGRELEQIHSHRFRGVKVMATHLPSGRAGSAFVELYVLPWEMPDAAIGLYGRGGTRICLLTDLADFKVLPWTDLRLEGYIRCDRLKRTADKTAVVQDQVYSVFVAELRKLEARIQQLIGEVSTQSQERRFNIILNRAGRLIDKFLRYREKGILLSLPLVAAGQAHGEVIPGRPFAVTRPADVAVRLKERAPVVTRAPFIRLTSPSQERATFRSWYDPNQAVICINREHAEFLLSQREDRRCVRYLFTVWAKESLLQEYGSQAEKVADEMVGVLAEAEPLLW